MTSIPLTDADLSRILAVLAREKDAIFLETARVAGEEHRSYLFRQAQTELVCPAGGDPGVFFEQAEEYLRQGYFLAGWMAYEFAELLEPSLARRVPAIGPLARFGVFREPHIFDHRSGSFSGAGPWPESVTDYRAGLENGCRHETGDLNGVQVAASGPTMCSEVSNLRPSLTEADYQAAIGRIKEYIAAGDTYQVNYTLKLLFDFSGTPVDLYRRLRRNQSVSFGACIRSGSRWILSFSPELFFRKNGEDCLVRPMKGTIGRGVDRNTDRRLMEFLVNDEKNRSENVMIVDLLRNDLGRISRPGMVRVRSLFDIETYETLHQMTSSIVGKLKPELGIKGLIEALFPCGSVTGAPKIRTMQIIRELEREARGVYTGAIGFFAPNGEAVFNVPIRTIEIEAGRGEMGIGSGVVYDSDPKEEWRECLLKGRFLTDPAPVFSLIETLLWQPGSGYWLLDAHLERLADSAAYFLFPCKPEEVLARLKALASGFGPEPMRVRLTLARDGGLELVATPGPAQPPVWDISADGEVPADLPRLVLSQVAIDPSSPYLFHKTSLRHLYDDERRRAVEAGFYEVLFTNTRGELTEGAISNLFILRDGRILTPALDCGLLNGVFRRHLLAKASLPVTEAILRPSDLAEAEAIFIGNSVRGLVRVRLD